ncbi:bifunctional biotin--[acetyl-CoA-carboxylase] ligase/biotin operon repressor BirA [Aggregatibacter actinomycetemcomitans]|uniref:bifunctional biotin--[acetyl-CoA-carboxylase] ligase/biotin operon repressor BirA n=1 Tax=Aggregatibacter actinomycetemcomitans TaxID=714 RepID=UPI001EEC6B32|nr:bifunctional biotin--[acetyl-CoA-carboxylase] ligase/biotin operon repressor BirA [Aggregatibacter actinomycetemcomitans]
MAKLLELLVSGVENSLENLTALLGCDAQQLQQEILQLEQQGICFEVENGHLYLIPEMPLLDEACLTQALAPYGVTLKPVISSTNQYLLDHLEQLQKGDLCLAEYQTTGRGRRGRQWISPFAGQIIMSFYWQLNPTKSLDGLSSVIGLAIVQALAELDMYGFQVKWPNDILVNDRKLAGILVEIVNRKNGMLNLIVGIGMNISLGQNKKIDQPWAELSEFFPQVDREQIIIKMTKTIYRYLERFEQHGIDAELQQQWLNHDAYFGAEVNVITEKSAISGTEQGIDAAGHLCVITENGRQYFNAGEVSLRKK